MDPATLGLIVSQLPTAYKGAHGFLKETGMDPMAHKAVEGIWRGLSGWAFGAKKKTAKKAKVVKAIKKEEKKIKKEVKKEKKVAKKAPKRESKPKKAASRRRS